MDLSKLGDRAAKWQMHSNVNKCKGMHTGARKYNFKCKLMGFELTDQEKDLSMLVDSLMKVLTQCAVAVANSMVVIIKTDQE